MASNNNKTTAVKIRIDRIQILWMNWMNEFTDISVCRVYYEFRKHRTKQKYVSVSVCVCMWILADLLNYYYYQFKCLIIEWSVYGYANTLNALVNPRLWQLNFIFVWMFVSCSCLYRSVYAHDRCNQSLTQYKSSDDPRKTIRNFVISCIEWRWLFKFMSVCRARTQFGFSFNSTMNLFRN